MMNGKLTYGEYQELLRILESEITGIRKQRDAAHSQFCKDGTFAKLLSYSQERLEKLLTIKATLVTFQASEAE